MTNPTVKRLEPDLTTKGQLAEQLKASREHIEKKTILDRLNRAEVSLAAARELPDEISGEPAKISDCQRRLEVKLWRRPTYIFEFHQGLIYYIEHYDIRVPDELLDVLTLPLV